MRKSFNLGIVAGEESGDLLGADLVASLKMIAPQLNIRLFGVGGAHLQQHGLLPLFNMSEISLMGLGEVLCKLPKLLYYINKLARYLSRQQLDCVLIIDSPDFTHRVAKKIKKLCPDLPIVQYIAPSVWAWREHRAQAMKDFIDHLLVVLPFEASYIRQLNGPACTYVGHKLCSNAVIKRVASDRLVQQQLDSKLSPALLLLPGSRRSEIKRLMPLFGAIADNLCNEELKLRITIVTLPHLKAFVSDLASAWRFRPIIVAEDKEKWEAIVTADIALSASGTVLLELALCGIPTISVYKMDMLAKIFIKPRIKIWSAALPNIITGKPILPEFYNEYARADTLTRHIVYLLGNQHARLAQLSGFEEMRIAMHTSEPSGTLAARAILKLCNNI